MSRARWVIVAVVAAAPLSLGAQHDAVERYRAAVEQLERRHAELVQGADQLDALLAVEQPRVNVEVGGFSIDAPIQYSEVVRGAAVEADRQLRESIGAAADLLADRLPGVRLTFNLATRNIENSPRMLGPIQLTAAENVIVYTIELGGYSGGSRGSWATRQQTEIPGILISHLVSLAYGMLQALIPDEFNRWSNQTLRPKTDLQFRSTYRELAGSPFQTTRACRTDNAACLQALGLDGSADPWHAWYPGGDLERAVLWRFTGGRRGMKEGIARLPNTPVLKSCAEGVRDACYQYLEERTPVPPIDSWVREGVAQIALHMGGAGGVVRLLEATGSTRERLEFIAGAPINDILTEWKRQAFAAVGKPLTVPLRTGVFAIIWIAGFAGLSLRSTRWR